MTRKSILYIAVLLLFTQCSKDNSTGTTNGPISVKYEVAATSTIIESLIPYVLGYTNSTGQGEAEQVQLAGKSTWMKTINITTTQRPLTLVFYNPNQIAINTPGTVSLNIYINNSLKASSTIRTIPGILGEHVAVPTTVSYDLK